MTDDRQRRQAVDPARSVIVQAPAGSGKTTLLVERYLALLGQVEAPEEILAITFTRKAAAEMRARILRFLDPEMASAEPHERAALDKARAVAAKAAEWGLRDNPQRLLIRTIDSFNHYLARTMPVASQLGPVPAPAEHPRALYGEAARRVLALADGDEPIAADVRTLLLWRDHREQDIEQLLVAMLGRREQWLRALGVTGEPDRERLEAVLHETVAGQLAAARRMLEAALAAAGFDTEELCRILHAAADHLTAAGRDTALAAWRDARDLPAADPADLPRWRGLGNLLLTGGGTWRAAVNKNDGFPPDSEYKPRMQSLLDALRPDDALATALAAARSLPEPRYHDREWQALAALIRVLERAAGELELVFAETGHSDFAGIGAAALRGLGDESSGYTDLALYLDRRIRHILVDEFQDTNWSQYALLERLVGGWQAGEGRSLFLVGDPMQSIYRFREAEVGLFMRARGDGIGEQPLESCPLTRNFRSRVEIVDWVNHRIGPIFPAEEDIAAGAVGYAGFEPARDGGGRVAVLARSDRAAEGEAVAAHVAQALEAHRDDPEFSAAIIVRARTHLNEVLPALDRRGIGYRAVKLDRLLERPVARDLLAITRAVSNPADTAAVLAILRSPVCGLTLDSLHRLAGDGRSLADADALERLEAGDRDRAGRVFAALEAARAQWRRRSLRDLVEGVWTRLGGPAVLRRPDTDHRDATRFLDTLASAEQQGLAEDFHALQDLLEEQLTEGDPPGDDIRLEILTMHGAKGLQWDLVVIPGLDRTTGGGDRALLHWLPFTPPSGDERVLIAPLRAADESENTRLVQMIGAEERRRAAFENQRLLYVAATRAREELVLSAALDPARDEIRPTAGSLLADLWPTCAEEFRGALQAGGHPDADRSDARPAVVAPGPDQTLYRVPDDWQPHVGTPLAWRPELPPRERRPEIEFHWAGIQARRVGTVLHRLLEGAGRIGSERLDAAARQRLIARVPVLLKALGTGAADLDEAVDVVRAAFDRTLASDTGRWILSGEHADAACELEISGVLDGELVHAVIDRTFIDADGTRWIIDYKSGYHEGGDLEGFLGEEAARYEVQLATYRRLFEQMGEKALRTALYLPRHGQLKEVESPAAGPGAPEDPAPR